MDNVGHTCSVHCKAITLVLKVSNNIERMKTSHLQLYGIHLAMEGYTTLSWFLNGFNSTYMFIVLRDMVFMIVFIIHYIASRESQCEVKFDKNVIALKLLLVYIYIDMILYIFRERPKGNDCSGENKLTTELLVD